MEGLNHNNELLGAIKGNHSIVGEIEGTSDFHEMKTEVGNDVEKFSKKQHFVSLLASALVPIAAIGTKGGKYYSELADGHESYDENSEKAPLYSLVQYVLFRDTDKPGFDRPNIIGDVSFDFDYARFDKEDLPPYAMRLAMTVEKLKTVSSEDIAAMLDSVKAFQMQISGEEGKDFLESVIEKSEYKIFSSQHIQDILLERACELEGILNERLKRVD